MIQSHQRFWMRPAVLLPAALLAAVLAGCNEQQNNASPPPTGSSGMGRTPGGPANAGPPKTGKSTGKKVTVALEGPALLYYLVKYHPQQGGQEVQYFRSASNGNLYYRDPTDGRAHLIEPDKKGYDLDSEDQEEMKKLKGYKKQATGENYNAPETGTGNK